MLSLPLLPPRLDACLWPSHTGSNSHLDAPSTDTNNTSQTNQQQQQQQQRRPTSHHGHSHHGQHHATHRSQLAALTADENTIYQRKQNVRRFGAGWIRPPGVPKTYQAIMDEEAEREEQETLARREQVLLDLQTAQTDAANREAAAEGADAEMEGGEGEGERDLDDDVPEAAASESELSDSEDEGSSGLEEGDTSVLGQSQADMTFNEDSFIEGSVVADGEVEHMLEREEAEIAGVLQDERDLDDDVPEAGSYEHTDTELDSDSDVGADSSRLEAPSTGHRRSSRRESHVTAPPTTGNRRSSRRSSGLPSVMSARTAATRSAARSARGASQQASRASHYSGASNQSGASYHTSRAEQHSGEAPQRSGLHIEQRFEQHQHFEASGRSSFGLDGSSSLLDSSFVRSSPVAARASLRSRFMGMGGRGRGP